MRKVLISILIVLLLVLAYFIIFEGISIGTIKVSSVQEIIEANSELTKDIDETNAKIKGELQNKQTELSDNVDILLKNKEAYYKVANVSTENEINKANTEEIYNSEYLWLKIGRYARKEKVVPKMDVKTSDTGDSNIKDLGITVEGSYYGIIDFVSALEEDTDLNFRIDDFKLIPTEDSLQATFNVYNVRIKVEKTLQNVSTVDTNSQNNTDSTAQ